MSEPAMDDRYCIGQISGSKIFAYHLPAVGAVFELLPGISDAWSELLELVSVGAGAIVLTSAEEAALFADVRFQRRLEPN